MIQLPTNQGVTGGDLTGNGMLAGLDLMTSIQLLLVQDYDNQLKHLGKQMKVANQVKKAFRQEIESLQAMLTRPTREIGDHKDYVRVEQEDTSHIDWDKDFIGNEFSENTQDVIKTQKKYDEMGDEWEDGARYVRKADIEHRINALDTKLDSVNEQSEIMSLKLQGLTNQRKIAFETVSNVFRKEADTLGTIVRNLIG
jgi:chromosome segregation ATPase